MSGSRRLSRMRYAARREALRRLQDQGLVPREATTYSDQPTPCSHCDGTGQVLWRPPEQAGGVGEECMCGWCGGTLSR